MAPGASKHAKRRSSVDAQDVVCYVARKQVKPAIEGLLRLLESSANSLFESTSAAAVGAIGGGSKALRRASSLVGDAVVVTVESAERCCLCVDIVRNFLSGEGPGLCSKLPVAFVLWLLQLLYSAFVFVYMPAAGIALNSPTSLIFHAFVILTLASFFQAVTTDPGGVPEDRTWRTKGCAPQGLTERKRGTNEARWCDVEKCYKPDRAHHCKVLGRNVLRMDHHCPWINNTVGHANHKYFFNFLLWASAACGFFGVNVMQLLVSATLPSLSSFLLITSEGLTALLGGILGPFLGFHCVLLARNLTTIEWVEGCRDPKSSSAEKEGAEASSEWKTSAYDKGFYHNVSTVLGNNPLLWAVPVGGPAGDGLSFELTEQAAAERMKVPLETPGYRRAGNPIQLRAPRAAVQVGAGAREIVGKAADSETKSVSPSVVSTAVPESLAPDMELGDCNIEEERWREEWWAAKGGDEDDEDWQEPAEDSDQDLEAAGGGGWSSWLSPVELAEDLSVGLSYIGANMAGLGHSFVQAADETAQRFVGCCVAVAPEEKKARRASWSRQGRRSLSALDKLGDPIQVPQGFPEPVKIVSKV